MQGQAALEYVIIAGMLLVLIIPVFWYSFGVSRETMDLRETKDAAEKIARAADSVSSLGPGSKMYVWVRIPCTVKSSTLLNNTILFQADVGHGLTDVFELTRACVVGILPEECGQQRVLLQMLDTGCVQIGEALEISPNPFVATILPGQSNSTLFNVTSNVDYSMTALAASIIGDIESWTVLGAVNPLVSVLPGLSWDLFDVNITVPSSQASGTYDSNLLVSSSEAEALSNIQVYVPQVLTHLNISTFGYTTPVDIGFLIQGNQLSTSERDAMNWLDTSSSGEGFYWDYDIISDSAPTATQNFTSVPENWSATSGGSGYIETTTSNDVYATVSVAQDATENLTLDFPNLGIDRTPESVNLTIEYSMSEITGVGGGETFSSQIDSMDDVSDWSEEYGATLGSFTTDSGTKQEGNASMKLTYAFAKSSQSQAASLSSGTITGDSTQRTIYGSASDTASNNDVWYGFGWTLNPSDSKQGWAELTYDLNSLNVDENDITAISVASDYCFSGDSSCGSGAGPNKVSAVGTQDVEIYNYDTTSWTDIGNLAFSSSDTENSGSWSVSSGFDSFVSPSNRSKIRFEHNVAQAAGDTSAVVSYTQSGSSNPRWREGDSSGWESEASAGAVGSTDIRWTVFRCSPVRDLCILATVDGDNDINVQIWNGTWGDVLELETAATKLGKCVDIAFEDSSGDAMIVYDGNDEDVFYRTRSDGASNAASTWGSEQIYATSTVNTEILWIRLESVPDTNILTGMSLDAANDVHGFVWGGSSWTSTMTLDAASEDHDSMSFDMAYVSDTDRTMFVWADNSRNKKRCLYRLFDHNTNSWSSEYACASRNDEPGWIELDSFGTDRVMVVRTDDRSNSRIEAAIWQDTGGAGTWSSFTVVDTNTEYFYRNRVFDAACETSGDQCVVVWGNYWDSNYAYYSTYTVSGGWTSTNTSGISLSGEAEAVTLKSDPYSDEIALVIEDLANDVYTSFWNGDEWAPTTLIETSGYNEDFHPVDIEYKKSDKSKSNLLLDRVALTITAPVDALDKYAVKKTLSNENWTASPLNVSMWVYGDNGGEDFTLNITDSGGGSYEWTPLDVNWAGWAYKSFSLSGTSGVDLDNVNSIRIKLLETTATDNPSGTIYVDDLRRYYTTSGVAGDFSCDLECYGSSGWATIDTNLATVTDTFETWNVSSCIDSIALANDVNVKFNCENTIPSTTYAYIDYARVDAAYEGTSQADAVAWNTSTLDSGTTEIQTSDDVYADEVFSFGATEQLEMDFPDLGVIGAPFDTNSWVEYKYSQVNEPGRVGGSGIVTYLHIYPSLNPINVQLNEPFNITMVIYDQAGNIMTGQGDYININSIKNEGGAAAAFSTQPVVEDPPGYYKLEVTLTSGNNASIYYINGDYSEGSIPNKYLMWWHDTVNLNLEPQADREWTFLPETDYVTLPATGGTINLKLYCINQEGDPLTLLDPTDFTVSNVKSESGSSAGGWTQGTVTYEGDGIYNIPLNMGSLNEGQNYFFKGEWKNGNKAIDFGASFYVNSTDPFAPAPDNPFVAGTPGGNLECDYECRGESGWVSVGSLNATTTESSTNYSLDTCVTTETIANDIHTRFNCDNGYGGNITLYVDHANASVDFVSGDESWLDLDEINLCDYRAIMMNEYTYDTTLNSALNHYTQNCGCLMLTGNAASDGAVGLGYASSAYDSANDTIYIVDDSHYVTTNYTNSSLVTVYTTADSVWGNDAEGALATSAGNTLGEDGNLMYYGVNLDKLTSDGNNTMTRFVDHCLMKYSAKGALIPKTEFRCGEDVVYEVVLQDQGYENMDSNNVDSWIWSPDALNVKEVLDASSTSGTYSNEYNLPAMCVNGTWTVNATANAEYGSAYNYTYFQVV